MKSENSELFNPEQRRGVVMSKFDRKSRKKYSDIDKVITKGGIQIAKESVLTNLNSNTSSGTFSMIFHASSRGNCSNIERPLDSISSTLESS